MPMQRHRMHGGGSTACRPALSDSVCLHAKCACTKPDAAPNCFVRLTKCVCVPVCCARQHQQALITTAPRDMPHECIAIACMACL